MKRHLVLAVLSAGTAAVVLAGCASGSGTTSAPKGSSTASSSAAAAPTGTPASGPHNQADLAFATDMIPHHTQAVQMSDMAATAATNAEVKTLAAAIKDAQDPEIAQMSGWLAGWDGAVPTGSSMDMGTGMDTGSGTGMMSDAEMADLDKATGATFDRMWVTMMITHHQGAVAMAQTELADGENPDAQTLAASIVSSQTAQIAQLQALLRTLPAA